MNIATILKFLLACVGPGLVLYAAHLYGEYHALGEKVMDSVHVVRLENHGSVRYITEAQYHNLQFFLIAGAVTLVAFLATIVVIKMRK